MNTERDLEIVKEYTGSLVTMEEIGIREGITRERVRQILAAHGVRASRSYRALSRGVRRAQAQHALWDRHCQSSYGCDFQAIRNLTGRDRFKALRSHELILQWWQHKDCAKRFFVPWEFTLPQYASFIGDRLFDLGRTRNALCLVRKDASGPYSPSNCELITKSELSKRTNGFGVAVEISVEKRKVRSMELAKQAAALRAQGKTIPETAKILGKSESSITLYRAIAKRLNLA